MSLCTLSHAMDRISIAEPDSQIAVFASKNAGRVEVVFADTVHAQQAIRRKIGLIGVFDRTCDKRHVKERIKRAMSIDPKVAMKNPLDGLSLQFVGRLR